MEGSCEEGVLCASGRLHAWRAHCGRKIQVNHRPGEMLDRAERRRAMPGCKEMKKGEVYVCEGCGVEFEVVRVCCTEETREIGEGCACHVEANSCEVKCCDKLLKRKSK